MPKVTKTKTTRRIKKRVFTQKIRILFDLNQNPIEIHCNNPNLTVSRIIKKLRKERWNTKVFWNQALLNENEFVVSSRSLDGITIRRQPDIGGDKEHPIVLF